MPELTPVPGAEPRYDDDGNEIIEVATCGVCGRSWNDAAVSSWTPAPSGRCPFEYEHEDEEDEEETVEVVYEVTIHVPEHEPIPEEHILAEIISKHFPEVVTLTVTRQ
jgi:hypothetical protein